MIPTRFLSRSVWCTCSRRDDRSMLLRFNMPKTCVWPVSCSGLRISMISPVHCATKANIPWWPRQSVCFEDKIALVQRPAAAPPAAAPLLSDRKRRLPRKILLKLENVWSATTLSQCDESCLPGCGDGCHSSWAQYRPDDGKFFPENLDASLCTHVNFAFAVLKDSKLASYEWNDEDTEWSKGQCRQSLPNTRVRDPTF